MKRVISFVLYVDYFLWRMDDNARVSSHLSSSRFCLGGFVCGVLEVGGRGFVFGEVGSVERWGGGWGRVAMVGVDDDWMRMRWCLFVRLSLEVLLSLLA